MEQVLLLYYSVQFNFSGDDMRILLLSVIFIGCGDFIELPDESKGSADVVAEKSRDCQIKEVHCERACFSDYGQFWGTFSWRYNSCMKTCGVEYDRCLLRPNTVDGSADVDQEQTYSWEQPPSEGVGGYYGYCGPTAVSNLIANVCGEVVNPYEAGEKCFSAGPGASPSAMVRALNELGGCGEFALCEPEPGESHGMTVLEANLPAAVLLDWDAFFTLHWVTVVAIDWSGGACHVRYNHWGRQDKMACDEFVERWSLTRTTTGRASVFSRILKPFTYICEVSE